MELIELVINSQYFVAYIAMAILHLWYYYFRNMIQRPGDVLLAFVTALLWLPVDIVLMMLWIGGFRFSKLKEKD